MMKTVKVFPDHCSSGLWNEEGANMCESTLEDILDPVDFIALKYWHSTWEFLLSGFPLHKDIKMREGYFKRWNKDGQAMVDCWNAKQDKVKFVYCPEEV
jgi:hypothetical protein